MKTNVLSPALSAGAIQLALVVLTMFKFEHICPPTVTVAPFRNPDPVNTKVLRPSSVITDGETLEIVGARSVK